MPKFMHLAALLSGEGSMTDAISGIIDLASSLLTMITGNPALAIFFFAGLIGIAVGVIKKLKKS